MNVTKDAAPKDISIYRPKLPTDSEGRAQKRQVELITEDVKRICTGNIHQPFSSLQDAIDRLLPYHILGELDGDAADVDEDAHDAASRLLIGRRDALADLALRHATDAARSVHAVRQHADQTLRRLLPPTAPHKAPPPSRSASATSLTSGLAPGGTVSGQGVLPAGAGGTVGASTPSTPLANNSGASGALSVPSICERHALERLLVTDAHEMLEVERRRPAGYRSPTGREMAEAAAAQAVAAAAASAAAAAAAAAAGSRLNAAAANDPSAVSLPVGGLPAMDLQGSGPDDASAALDGLPAGAFDVTEGTVGVSGDEYEEDDQAGEGESEEGEAEEGEEAVGSQVEAGAADGELDGEGEEGVEDGEEYEGHEGLDDEEGDPDVVLDEGEEADADAGSSGDGGLDDEEDGDDDGGGAAGGLLDGDDGEGALGYADDGEMDFSDDLDDVLDDG